MGQGDVDEDGVVAAEVLAHLANGFQEGQRFDVADRAADLNDRYFAIGSDLAHRIFDLVGDVRDDLDGLPEVVAAALLGDDLFVDASGGKVIVARELGVGEALIVAEVEIGLSTVVGDEDLAMLEGRHRAGVDVQVGVKLHDVDLDAACLEQAADGCRSQTLAERRHNSACYKDVFR
jgi:hypothetical protein